MEKAYQQGHTADQGTDSAVGAPGDEDRGSLKRRWETGMRRAWRALTARFGWGKEPALECKHWAQIHAMERRRPARSWARMRCEGWRKRALEWLSLAPPPRHWAQIHAAAGGGGATVRATRFSGLHHWWQRAADRLRTWRRQLEGL